ncbi:carboxypeptidase B-like [Stegodyphus dumicola]|uniref:carboxypeptidase B-like n=1 Tax=Stegodyphus dumicola TaxID=202533 RepID=UPI0015A8BF42|nr:carboxypeptidase B-like [Stegodyphus dumicola]
MFNKVFPTFCIVIFLTTTISSSLKESVSYDGYALLRITPTTEHQLQYLLKLNANASNGLDFWLRSTAVNNSADVMVTPEAKRRLCRSLNNIRIPYKVLIQDLGRLIAEDQADTVIVPPGLEFFADYNPVDEINIYMRDLALKYPDVVSLIEIGTSFEGRPLFILRISTPFSEPKPSIWIQGGAHAREQIGPAVLLFIALQLSSSCNRNAEIFTLVNTFEWYIDPIVNPDGYEYCQIDRLWRKTRSRCPSSKCVGVDANRNWDFKWNDAAGSSTNPCSHNYAGPEPFSEPETRAIAEFMLDNLKGRLELFIDIHSYSQRWMTPWGYTTKLPPNYREQKLLAEVATKALETVYGTKYTVGSSGSILYTVSGGARDWVYGTLGAKYSYVVEVRDKGDFGFLLSRKQILPTVVETWTGVKAMACALSKWV